MKNTAVVLPLFLLALCLRVYQLGQIGLSEDEARKILATESYRRGDFSANAEHPMLLKSLATICVVIAEKTGISPEAAVRFPAALTGALIVLALYLLGKELFGHKAGLIAASLWTVDLSAVAFSRIAKEDSLMTLCFLLGNYFLLRGKRFHFSDQNAAVKAYVACGAFFGAMFASKYFIPYIWFTLVYYDIFRFRAEPKWRLPKSWSWKLYTAAVAAFLMLNPVVLSPATWDYAWKYFTHQMSEHHGYWMMGKIYLNDAMLTYWGVPSYFFPLYFFVKTPIPLLAALLVGAIYALRRIREDSFLFVSLFFWIWLFLISISGSKFARHVLSILPAVILLQTLGILVVSAAVRSFLEKRRMPLIARAAMIFIVVPMLAWNLGLNWKYHPHQSFYVSLQGGGEKRHGYYFPQDEFYDAGLREAIQFISLHASRNANVIATTPAVLEYYKHRYHRGDLQYISMTVPRLSLPENAYFLVQEYRTYVENYYILVFLHSQLKPLFTADVLGRPSVVVCYLSEDSRFAKAPYWMAKHWPGALRDVATRSNLTATP